MKGSFTPSSASRSATLVCVKPPGLMMAKLMPLALRRLHAVDQLVLGIALKGDELVPELAWRRSWRALRWRPACPSRKPRVRVCPAGSGSGR